MGARQHVTKCDGCGSVTTPPPIDFPTLDDEWWELDPESLANPGGHPALNTSFSVEKKGRFQLLENWD